MADLLIRGVTPDQIEKLKRRAGRNRRSLQAELMLLVERAVAEEGAPWMEKIEKAQAILGGQRFDDSAVLIREDRER
jgi:plasmid stability protein